MSKKRVNVKLKLDNNLRKSTGNPARKATSGVHCSSL